jgi:hypothetical protein
MRELIASVTATSTGTTTSTDTTTSTGNSSVNTNFDANNVQLEPEKETSKIDQGPTPGQVLEIEECYPIKRQYANRKQKMARRRVWMHAKIVKKA